MKIDQLTSTPKGVIFTHEVLEDGTVKTQSGRIAMPIHSRGEALLRDLIIGLNAGKGANTRTNLPHAHRDTGMHVHGGEGKQH